MELHLNINRHQFVVKCYWFHWAVGAEEIVRTDKVWIETLCRKRKKPLNVVMLEALSYSDFHIWRASIWSRLRALARAMNKKIIYSILVWYTQVKLDSLRLGIKPTTFKASYHKRFLLRFAARFSPFEGCEKVDELQMFQVMIFHNNTISNPLFHFLQKES